MNKESAKKAGKFFLGVLGSLFVIGFVKSVIAPKLPASAQKVLGFVGLA